MPRSQCHNVAAGCLKHRLCAAAGLLLLALVLQAAPDTDPPSPAAPSPNPNASADSWRDRRRFSWVARPEEPSTLHVSEETEDWFEGTTFLLGAIGLGLVAVLVLRRWNARVQARQERIQGLLAEDPMVAELLRSLSQGAPNQGLGPGLPEHALADEAAPQTKAQPENLALANKNLVGLWAKFQKSSRRSDDSECAQMLEELIQQAELIKAGSDFPHLRPIALLASALQGLLRQLSKKSANITPSALRTAAGGIDLMGLLCTRTFRADLATEPPIRLLVVDDEPISRTALCSALKRIFKEPDLAHEGKTALSLVEQRRYDLVLLDVEMPGLDGFEVCTKIHDTAQNCATPVVFVTSHCDFESRAKSAEVGAHDLIGKPFLAFEVMLKALTLVLRARLKMRDAKLGPCEAEELSLATPAANSSETTEPKGATTPAAPNEPPGAKVNERKQLAEPALASANKAASSTESSPRTAPAASTKTTASARARSDDEPGEPTRDEMAQAFFEGAPTHLKMLRERLGLARDATLPAERDQILGEVFIGMHAIGAEAGRAQLGAAFRVASALEAMLKKLIERPAFCTPSVFQSAAAAIETVERLCQTGKDIDLTDAPICLLVVDDDPVARRAFSGALQLAIARPDSSDCGAAALALARKKAYDLIFLDVLMPGMDGFAVCSKLHDLELNARTPVIFITSQDDQSSRAKAAACGGCGFIPKPVLPCEVLLVALTFIVRGRLLRLNAHPWEQEVPASSGATVTV